ncbi:MAG: alpha/beta hydrolase [Parasporobacterium sp.]|nr:alpha/beta hydrolase [Parasporobacterium sp.]
MKGTVLNMFSMNSTYRSITSDPDIYLYVRMFIPPDILNAIPPEMYDCSMQEIKDSITLPWGVPYISEQVVYAAVCAAEIKEGNKWSTVSVWNPVREDFVPAADNSKNCACIFFRKEPAAECSGSKRPAVIICPGGAYEKVAMSHEGFTYAEILENAGFRSFVLNYRTVPNYYPEPQKDLLLAIKYLRLNSEKLGIDPEKIILVGSSAGGHLVASEALYSEDINAALLKELAASNPVLYEKYADISSAPDMLGLCYPVISFVSEQHEGSFINLSGGDESLRDKLSVDLNADSSYPRTFIWRCDDDELVPASNSDRMYEALKKAGVEAKICRYPSGGHGIGLADGTSAEGWIHKMIEFFR